MAGVDGKKAAAEDNRRGPPSESPSVSQESAAVGGSGSTPGSQPTADGANIPGDEVAGHLCHLLKAQLIKAHQEIVRRAAEVNLTDLLPDDLGGRVDAGLCDKGAFTADVSSSPVPPLENEAAAPAEMKNEGPLDTSLSAAVETSTEEPSKVVPLSPGSFVTADVVPPAHKFKLTVFQPANMRSFVQSVRKEIRLLQSSLPAGITVKGYDERMDLYSVMIEGPKNTPYEDGLFLFDFQLGETNTQHFFLCDHHYSKCYLSSNTLK
jgi:ubiquitin-conjugating enzyme E2 O